MKIQVGQVKYKGRDDYRVVYGTTDDGKLYYFLDDVVLENGGRIASTELVEAIDNSVKPSHIGVVNNAGKEIISCNNKNVKLINDGILLVELSEPKSDNVKSTNILRNDPTAATKLVSTPAAIKSKIGAIMSKEGRYVFNDLFSEAYICDLEANALVDGLYSFIAVDPVNQKIYLSKNDVNEKVIEYSILPPQVQNDVTPATDSKEIDVTDVNIPQEAVEDALNATASPMDSNVVDDIIVPEKPAIPDIPAVPVAPVAPQAPVTPATPVIPQGNDTTTVQEKEEDNSIVEKNDVQNIPATESEKVEESNQMVTPEATQPEQAENALSNQEEVVPAPVEEKEEVKPMIPDISAAPSTVDDNVESTVENTLENKVDTNDDISSEKVEEEIPVEKEVVTEPQEISQVEKETEPEEFEFNQNVIGNNDTLEDMGTKNDLEEMYSEPEQENDDISNYSFDNYSGTELDGMLDDDILVDSEIKPDKIDTMDDFDINIDNSKPDNLIEDVAQSFKDLMKSNKEQRIVILKYKERIKKLEMSLNMLNEKKKTQAELLKELSNRYRKLENDYTRSKTRVQLLESKVEDQERVINSQERELTSIRPQLAGKEELARLLTDAKALLNNDSQDEDYYYRQAS